MENPKSQIPSSSYFSNSLISEPPDVKQWFSSYNYQSPELDTNEKDLCFSHGVVDEGRGLYVEDSETEDEGNGEDLVKRVRFMDCKSIEEVKENEGPSLLGVEVDDEGRGLYVEDSETEDEGNGEDLSKHSRFMECKSIEEVKEYEGPSLPGVEVQTYPDSLSMSSEPPDITNWFSSYVYESPELDSAEFDVSLSSDRTFGKRKELDKGVEDHLKGVPVMEVRDEILNCTGINSRFNGVENCKSPSTLKESGSERSNLSPENGSCPARAYDERNFEAELNNCSKIQDKLFGNPRIKSEDIISAVKVEQHLSNKEHLTSPAKTPGAGGGFTRANEEKTTATRCVADENDSGWISLKHKRREENQVTIMKSARPRANKENSPVNSVCSPLRRKVERLRREILKETTNFNLPSVPEVSGKWKCPQRYKPDTGPPMKQLRLEKWFHR